MADALKKVSLSDKTEVKKAKELLKLIFVSFSKSKYYPYLKSSYVLLLDILDIVISEYGMDSQRIKNVIFQFEIKSR